MGVNYSSEQPKTGAVSLYISFFNDLVDWIRTLFCFEFKPKNRNELRKKLLEVCEILRIQNNFSGLIAITSALESPIVDKLCKKNTIAKSKAVTNLFSYLQPEGNHGAYRAALSSAQKKGEPHLPHLAVHLRDFLYISDAVEKDTSMEVTGKYNLFKCLSVGRAVFGILKYRPPYQLDIHEDHDIEDILTTFPLLTEEEMWACNKFHVSRANITGSSACLDFPKILKDFEEFKKKSGKGASEMDRYFGDLEGDNDLATPGIFGTGRKDSGPGMKGVTLYGDSVGKSQAVTKEKRGLFSAVQEGNSDILRELLNDPEILRNINSEEKGQTVLSLSASNGHVEIVVDLLLLGADPNFQLSESMRTALHVGAKGDSVEVVAALLLGGADPEIKDKFGKTPKDEASPHSSCATVLGIASENFQDLYSLHPYLVNLSRVNKQTRARSNSKKKRNIFSDRQQSSGLKSPRFSLSPLILSFTKSKDEVGDQETNKEITRASSYFELDTKFSDSAECIEKILAEYYGNFSGSTTGATLNDDPTVKVKEELANLNMAVKEILGACLQQIEDQNKELETLKSKNRNLDQEMSILRKHQTSPKSTSRRDTYPIVEAEGEGSEHALWKKKSSTSGEAIIHVSTPKSPRTNDRSPRFTRANSERGSDNPKKGKI